jgi:hypothetical protein
MICYPPRLTATDTVYWPGHSGCTLARDNQVDRPAIVKIIYA